MTKVGREVMTPLPSIVVRALACTALVCGVVGCDGAIRCASSGDCGAGHVCINDVCEPLAALPDGGARDAETADAGPCACGAVDVDGNGVVDDRDFDRLASLSMTDSCVLMAADTNLDGAYDAEDEYVLRAIANGTASAACATCGGQCADSNGDGATDDEDVTAAASLLGSVPSPCDLLAADIDRDGVVGQVDAWLIAAIATGDVSAECMPCGPDHRCGDVNGDGRVGVADALALDALLISRTAFSPCSYSAADVVRDGLVDRRDSLAIRRLAGGSPSDLGSACEPCPSTGACGDLTGDGLVSIGDSAAIADIAAGGDADLCARSRADLNADGLVDARDSSLARDLQLGAVQALARCPECTNLCGDVNQDGSVTAADRVGFDALDTLDEDPLCARAAADVNGDGSLDDRDARLIDGFVAGTLDPGLCGPCGGICGDLDGDGVVTESDKSVVRALEMSGRLPSACELDDGDIDHDGDVDTDDGDSISEIAAGAPPPSPCGR